MVRVCVCNVYLCIYREVMEENAGDKVGDKIVYMFERVGLFCNYLII